MLTFYVLFACLHYTRYMPSEPGLTRCFEGKVYFQADRCKAELSHIPRTANRYARSWSECRKTTASSWVQPDNEVGGNLLYKAEAKTADEPSMAALLSALTPQARVAVRSEEQSRRPFRGQFSGPGNLSFFVLGDATRVIVFAVTNLNDDEFGTLAASAALLPRVEDNSDFEIAAEHAGVKLDYRTEVSQQRGPPSP